MKTILKGALAAAAISVAVPASAQNLTLSSSLPQVHFWVGVALDRFADKVEAETDVRFTRFYAGELVGVGRGLDALQGGTVDAVTPLLAPYHPGVFPLSDISQVPVYNTDSPAVTRAFQKMLDSDVELVPGKTFYDYEIGDKGIKAWALGATGAYAISTSGKEVREPSDFDGLQLRAGAALQTMTLEQLGVNPVTITGAEIFEAVSRNTIDGAIISVGDWKSYSLVGLLDYTIDGVALGHWESYNAMTQSAWDSLTPEQQEVFDQAAREVALETAEFIETQEIEVREEAREQGAVFEDVSDLSPEMQTHIADAGRRAWIQWIEATEANGHPARATAQLWAELIAEEGGELPEGVAEYLAD
ncbi:TRAP-type C4-dicarboxylate transport system, substrate-binding protein [Salinihabitans flavidus]|uniref:TRAP-type C4-dicarboxylate transport system, substrate-binding protein n=1 Tax=Salinihabitans flavidus TaxID=569882 RepID=A0A1H8UNZ6_9RHOB|nr:TRAP transporter substrate-binding protein DctP [Salinihabitans flavidus]SEP04932.1 TRAP-type C4-dicarboxylate transport system, substrate-binding protein [Salinihabitans flavidus]